MKRVLAVAVCLLFTAVVLAARQDSGSQASGGSTLKVMVHYNGSSKVDASHKIYVVLWSSSDFATGPPVQIQAVTTKNATATFSNVTASPVYVSAALDPNGAWDAQSPPPSGSSLGRYSKEPGKAAPVDLKPGKPVTIHLAFDDSQKVP